MKSKSGILCMILGVLLMLGSLILSYANRQEEAAAQTAVMEVIPQLVQQIQKDTSREATVPQEETIPELELQIPVELLTEEDKTMDEVEIEEHRYIGYLSIPKLGLELPVMSTWSYAKLNIAPCRYTGSIRGEDLVIMAHNYSSHFGKLSRTELGDQVQFTDVEGNVVVYEIVGKDVLMPTAVEEMIAGDFDLTLFTCTYGGKNRVTVYCDRVQEPHGA